MRPEESGRGGLGVHATSTFRQSVMLLWPGDSSLPYPHPNRYIQEEETYL